MDFSHESASQVSRSQYHKKAASIVGESQRSHSKEVSPVRAAGMPSGGSSRYDFLNGGIGYCNSVDWRVSGGGATGHSRQASIEKQSVLSPQLLKDTILKDNLRWSMSG